MTFPMNAHRRLISQSGSGVGVWNGESGVESEDEEEGAEREEEVVKVVIVITGIF